MCVGVFVSEGKRELTEFVIVFLKEEDVWEYSGLNEFSSWDLKKIGDEEIVKKGEEI